MDDNPLPPPPTPHIPWLQTLTSPSFCNSMMYSWAILHKDVVEGVMPYPSQMRYCLNRVWVIIHIQSNIIIKFFKLIDSCLLSFTAQNLPLLPTISSGGSSARFCFSLTQLWLCSNQTTHGILALLYITHWT